MKLMDLSELLSACSFVFSVSVLQIFGAGRDKSELSGPRRSRWPHALGGPQPTRHSERDHRASPRSSGESRERLAVVVTRRDVQRTKRAHGACVLCEGASRPCLESQQSTNLC
eukprot:983066-Prymnesium_polylepis.1